MEQPEVAQAQEIDEPVGDTPDEDAGPRSDITSEVDAASGSPRFNRKRKLVAGVLALSLALLAIGISLAIASIDSGGKQQVAEVAQSELIEEPVPTTTTVVETTSTIVDLSFLNALGASNSKNGAGSGPAVNCNVEARANQPIISGMPIVIESIEKISDNPEQWLQVSSLKMSDSALVRERTVFQCSGSQVIWNRAAPVEIVTLQPVPPPTTASTAAPQIPTSSLVP